MGGLIKEKTKSNDIELWKSALMTMPDNSFFELFRSVFGKIKTPFNKQQLLKDLEKFLLREDIQKTVSAYINENEEKIIAAIALFGKPSPEELERFFKNEFTCIQLHDIILNLEERLIIFRINDKKNGDLIRLALNPILEKTLAPFAENISVLFPQDETAQKTKKTVKHSAVLNDRILAGLLSFVSLYEDTAFYKQEGRLRKQITDAGKKIFPGLDLENVFGALQIPGLFYKDGENLHPDSKRFADMAALSARERMEYCAAGFTVYKEAGCPADIKAPYYKNRLKEAVNFIHALMESVYVLCKNTEKENSISEITISKLIEVHKSKTGYIADTSILLTALHNSSLFPFPFSLLPAPCSLSPAACSIDSTSSILIYPEINFADAIELAAFTNIKETGAAVRFELEKDSVVRAFDNGITAQNIIDTLNRLSGKKVPETLAYNLKDREKRHGEVSLKKGIVLTLSKDKQFLVQTKPLSALITETLAPGVYLLNEDTEKAAAEALHNAGVDIVARRKSTINATQTKTERHFPSLSSAGIIPKANTGKALQKDNQADKIIQYFHTVLNKMQPDKNSRDELSARINRRLILCEDQLKDANIRYEKLEARHMDYAGKQNIARQAISQGSLAEIKYHTGKSEGKVYGEKQIYGYPKALDKEKEDGITLVVASADEGKELRIPLAKISLIRRIKKSIFEG